MVHEVQANPLYVKPRHSDAALMTGVVLTAAALTVFTVAMIVFLKRSHNLAVQGTNPLVAPGATAGRFVAPGTVLEPLAVATRGPKIVMTVAGAAAGAIGTATLAYAIYRRVHPTVSYRDRLYLQEQYEIESLIKENIDAQSKIQKLTVKLKEVYGLMGAYMTAQASYQLQSASNNISPLHKIQPLAVNPHEVQRKKERYVAGYQYLANRIINAHNALLA